VADVAAGDAGEPERRADGAGASVAQSGGGGPD
jgi:hypothetical protein